MAWDTSMPLDFSDGQHVDEGDMDPIVKNLNTLRYATVFMAGVQRVTQVTGINTTTEQIVLQLPSVPLETGYLYKIEGMLKIINTVAANTAPAIIIQEGTTTAGATLSAFTTPVIDTVSATTGLGFYFSVFVKALANVNQAYNIATYRHRGTGTLIVDTTSWAAISRSGDSSLMTDV